MCHCGSYVRGAGSRFRLPLGQGAVATGKARIYPLALRFPRENARNLLRALFLVL